MKQPCLITTETHHYNDGSSSREQMVAAPSVAQVMAMYEAIAQIDAMIATGEVLERIGGE